MAVTEDDLILEDTEEVEAVDAKKKRKAFEKALLNTSSNMPNVWQYSRKGLEAKAAAMAMLTTKTGMYARIPLTCKGDSCPYSDQCQLLPYDMAPTGEPCPIETANVEVRAQAYGQEFDIDTLSFTDRSLLNEIIGLDIMLERCRALMNKEGTPVIDVTIGIAENGEEIRQPTVSKAWDAYEKMSKKRDTDYQLLCMTRKDKKKDPKEEAASSITDLIKSIDAIDITDVSSRKD